jgi:tRNA A37 methylthiotransferase MiaB
MKVLLIQPPVRDFYETSIRTQPIGLAYLAASLQSSGFDVDILDCRQKKKTPVPLPPELSYLREFYPSEDRSPFKLYSGYYHFGTGWNEIRQRIEASEADVFGISSSFTPYHQEALEISKMVKQGDNRRVVVMGGAHVSCDPEGVLQNPSVDYAVLGEGELRFPALLEALETGKRGVLGEIDGLGYRVNGKMRINPLQHFIHDLDTLAQPARDLFDWGRYRRARQKYTMIITSRGCPHQCAYCSTHLHMGAAFRARFPEKIVKEMTDCHDRYGIGHFDLEDDNFTFDQERAKELMKRIIETFGERRLELTAMNGVSFASLDADLVQLMRRAGFHTVNLSFVSTAPSLKKQMGRPTADITFGEILKKVEQAGLRTIAYAIFGMPVQTIEDMVDTSIYLMKKRVLMGPSIYYPTPRTPLFERCRDEGILPSTTLQWRSSAFPIETKEFDRLDLVTLFRLTRAINFIKGQIDHGEIEEGITWRDLFQVVTEKTRGLGLEEGRYRTGEDLNPCPMDEKRAWSILLLLLLRERSFFGLTKDHGGRISIMRMKSSKRVLDAFIEKAWSEPIVRSQTG